MSLCRFSPAHLFGRSLFYAFPVRHRSFLSHHGMDVDVKKMGNEEIGFARGKVPFSPVS
jgi:hypothetical protein